MSTLMLSFRSSVFSQYITLEPGQCVHFLVTGAKKSGKVTVERSNAGYFSITECSPDGRHITIENISGRVSSCPSLSHHAPKQVVK